MIVGQLRPLAVAHTAKLDSSYPAISTAREVVRTDKLYGIEDTTLSFMYASTCGNVCPTWSALSPNRPLAVLTRSFQEPTL